MAIQWALVESNDENLRNYYKNSGPMYAVYFSIRNNTNSKVKILNHWNWNECSFMTTGSPLEKVWILTVFLGQSMKFEGSAVLNAIKIAQF